jgi:hypothetical protein
MKAMFLVGVIAAFALFIGCNGDNSPSDDSFSFTGTVAWKTMESGFFAIDGDDGQGYEPINLPADFSVNGLRVQVVARERTDMASINMYGKIIEIIEISRL